MARMSGYQTAVRGYRGPERNVAIVVGKQVRVVAAKKVDRESDPGARGRTVIVGSQRRTSRRERCGDGGTE